MVETYARADSLVASRLGSAHAQLHNVRSILLASRAIAIWPLNACRYRRAMCRAFQVILGLTGFLTGCQLHAQEPRGTALLEWVQNAHRASRDGIQTLHCRVKHSAANAAECWFSPGVLRTKSKTDEGRQETLWKDNVRKVLEARTQNGQTLFCLSRIWKAPPIGLA